MSKAVLIMDMPKTCGGCRFYSETCYPHCEITGKSLRDNKNKPDCPLRKMPKKKEVCGRYEPGDVPASYKMGWNACLDALNGIEENPPRIPGAKQEMKELPYKKELMGALFSGQASTM